MANSINKPDSRGISFMLLGMFLLACNDAGTKYLTGFYSIPQVLWVRSWIFMALTLALVWPKGPLRVFRRTRRLGLQLGRCLLLLVEMGIIVFSFSVLPLAEVNAIVAASPLMVTALAVPLLAERVGIHRWTAVLVGFAGVLIIIRPGFATFDPLLLLPLLGALLWGIYQVQLRLLSRYDSPETTLVYTATSMLVAFTVIGPLYWHTPDTWGWLLLLLVGLLGSGAHYALIKALEAADASLLQPFSYTMLVWATLLGLAIFGDFPDGWTIAGALLVVSGGLYAFHRERKKKPSPPTRSEGGH